MKSRKLALLGDYSEAVVAHRAIPRALELARAKVGVDISWEWIRTRDLEDLKTDLAGYGGLWVVPASPYENTRGVLDAIRWARENGVPFLGTCGGFQHALIEFARNVAGIADADHAETNPDAATTLIGPLTCSLVEKSGVIHFSEGSRLAVAYGTYTAVEGYHCNYGFNSTYRQGLERAGLKFTAWDEVGEIRGAEIPTLPFFVGTLFQPERAALKGQAPAVAVALLEAIARR